VKQGYTAVFSWYTSASIPVSASGGFFRGYVFWCSIYAAPPCIFFRSPASFIVLLVLARRE